MNLCVFLLPTCVLRGGDYGRAVGGACCMADCCDGPHGGLWVGLSGVLGQSLALCASWHVAHTCLYVQFPGKMQAPQFHDMQMLSDLRLEIGEVVVGARAVGGCKHRSAHCARVWSTSRHSVQNIAPWPVLWPSIIDASSPGCKVFHSRDGSTAVC